MIKKVILFLRNGQMCPQKFFTGFLENNVFQKNVHHLICDEKVYSFLVKITPKAAYTLSECVWLNTNKRVHLLSVDFAAYMNVHVRSCLFAIRQCSSGRR